MMLCESPVQLGNGLVVPCGKCLLCLSAKRDDWSTRLQLHSVAYDSMPFFVTLTYETENLKYGDDRPTLCKSDIQLFIKRLKDRYSLYNTDFAYFGCGEYGSKDNSSVGIARPHYHLLLFGFNKLQEIYERSAKLANELIADIWKLGFVDVGVAEWSGIHYVTKYVLKYDDQDNYDGIEKPFIVFSQGLGLPWLKTRQGLYYRSRIDVNKIRQAYKNLPVLDTSSIEALHSSCREALNYLQKFMPPMHVELPSGRTAALPRFIRRKLYGSFEHFKDNPYWLHRSLVTLYNSCDYILNRGEYDQNSDDNYSTQVMKFAKYRIVKRLILNSRS